MNESIHIIHACFMNNLSSNMTKKLSCQIQDEKEKERNEEKKREEAKENLSRGGNREERGQGGKKSALFHVVASRNEESEMLNPLVFTSFHCEPPPFVRYIGTASLIYIVFLLLICSSILC